MDIEQSLIVLAEANGRGVANHVKVETWIDPYNKRTWRVSVSVGVAGVQVDSNNGLEDALERAITMQSTMLRNELDQAALDAAAREERLRRVEADVVRLQGVLP